MYLLQVSEEQLQPAREEGRPALIELLCDECEHTVDLDVLGEDARRDLLTTLRAR